MIIEPVPLGPPSARRRRVRVLAIVLPLVLLGVVAAAGSLGSPPPAPEVAVAASPVAIATPAPTRTPGATAKPQPGGLPAGVPARIAGLDVLTVREALELRADGLLEGVTAIGGYLGVRELPICAGTFCDRTGILAETPFTAATEFAEIGPHLHPQLPAGVVLPALADIAETGPPKAGAAAPATVIVARFDDPRARRCLPAGRHCGEALVVERVVWIDGRSYPKMLAVDPGLTDPPDERALTVAGRAAERGLGAVATPMLTTLVRPSTIQYIDPAMTPFLARLDAAPVWYVRGLWLREAGDEIVWVIAEADGSLISSGALPVLEPGDEAEG